MATTTPVTKRERLGCVWRLARRIWCLIRHQSHYIHKEGIYYDTVVCEKCHTHW